MINDRKKLQTQKNKERAKESVKNGVSKCMQTTMIGALDSFEKELRSWMCEGIPDEELTQDDIEFRESWARAREKLLDNGNKQIRKAMKLLDEYEFERKQYEYVFISQNK